jgi:hypothetical protein
MLICWCSSVDMPLTSASFSIDTEANMQGGILIVFKIGHWIAISYQNEKNQFEYYCSVSLLDIQFWNVEK